MSIRLIKGSRNGFGVKRSKNDILDDLVMELGRDGLDNDSVGELVRMLSEKYPENGAIIKLREAIGLELEEEPKEKEFIWWNRKPEKAASAANFFDERAATGNGSMSTNFYMAVDKIALDFLGIG